MHEGGVGIERDGGAETLQRVAIGYQSGRIGTERVTDEGNTVEINLVAPRVGARGQLLIGVEGPEDEVRFELLVQALDIERALGASPAGDDDRCDGLTLPDRAVDAVVVLA